MRKTIGGIVLTTFLLSPVQAGSTLKDKIDKFILEGKINPKHLISQYILQENVQNQRITSFVRRYDLEGKMLEEFYYLIPMNFKHPLGTSIPIIEKPAWYYYEGKWYKDDKMDGINGNEVEQKGGGDL